MIQAIWAVFIGVCSLAFLVDYYTWEPTTVAGLDPQTAKHFEFVSEVCNDAPSSKECEAMRWRIARYYGVPYQPLNTETPNSLYERENFEPEESRRAVYGDSDVGQMRFGLINKIFGD